MNIFDKIGGKILYFIARFFDTLFSIFIKITELVVNIGNYASGIIRLLMILFFLSFFSPLALFMVFNTSIIMSVIVLSLIFRLAPVLLEFLRYLQYMITEYFYERADNKLKGTKIRYSTFKEYGEKYKRMKEKREREEQQRRYEEAQRRQEEARRNFEGRFYSSFEDFFRNQQQSGGFGGYQQGPGQQGGFQGFNAGFKSQYEEACDILGVPYTADKDDIRTAYRDKAKKYHPDINKAENATEMFQKINDANDFLNEENRNNYKNMN